MFIWQISKIIQIIVDCINEQHYLKKLLMKYSIAVARSMTRGALSAVDKTMEQTFMKFAKSAGNAYYGLKNSVSKFLMYSTLCVY